MINYYGILKDFDHFLDKTSLKITKKIGHQDNREILKLYRTLTLRGPRQSGKTIGALLFHSEAYRSVYLFNDRSMGSKQIEKALKDLEEKFGKTLSENKREKVISVNQKVSDKINKILFKKEEDGSLSPRYETYILDLGGGPVSNAIKVMLANHADPSTIKIFEL